jgi:hypothetical protein
VLLRCVLPLFLQAGAISAWKLSPRSGAAAANLPRLDDSERRMLAVARSRRLSEVASKQCLQVIKALMAHKVRALHRLALPKRVFVNSLHMYVMVNSSSSSSTGMQHESCRNSRTLLPLLHLLACKAACTHPVCCGQPPFGAGNVRVTASSCDFRGYTVLQGCANLNQLLLSRPDIGTRCAAVLPHRRCSCFNSYQ